MKRERFLRELRKISNTTGEELEIFDNKGKGSHYRVKYYGKMSTIKSGELPPPGDVRLVKKQLGIE